MEIKQIKELMSAMERCGTTKIQIKKGNFELTLERSCGISYVPTQNFENESELAPPKFGQVLRKSNAPLPSSNDVGMTATEESSKKEIPGIFITSPMVGTFYSAPSPEDTAFIKVGDHVEKGAVVCIIEAMKVMNEIKSQVTGNVVEVLVENGHPVEFGTKLFRIQ